MAQNRKPHKSRKHKSVKLTKKELREYQQRSGDPYLEGWKDLLQREGFK